MIEARYFECQKERRGQILLIALSSGNEVSDATAQISRSKFKRSATTAKNERKE